MLRRALQLALWLLIGAALTLAVSWLLAASLPQRGWTGQMVFDPDFTGEDVIGLSQYTAFGSVRRDWSRLTPGVLRWPPFSPSIADARQGPDIVVDRRLRLMWPTWGNAERVRREPTAFALDGCEHATGWPVVAFWYEFQERPGAGRAAIDIAGGIPIGSISRTTRFTPIEDRRALPYRPIPAGVAIDAIVWGAIACAGFHVGLWVRGSLRLRRNRCPSCGYSLAGQAIPGCPECGWKRIERIGDAAQ